MTRSQASGPSFGVALAAGLVGLLLPIWRSPTPTPRSAAPLSASGPLPRGLPVWCPGVLVSAGFRDRRYLRATGLRHDGIDLVCPAGTPVRSTLHGQVVFLGRVWPLGVTVWLQRQGTRVIYAHLSRIARLSLGAWVAPGQVLGWEGQTGLTTGPHLLYEVEIDEPLSRSVPPTHWPGHAVNPRPTLGRQVPYAF